MPEKRWFTLREILSQFMVTMLFPSCHSQLQSGCIGVSDALLLHDGDILALIEWLYGFLPGDLGPGGRRQPPYLFRQRCLDRPIKEASDAARILVAEAISAVGQLDYIQDRVSCDAEFHTRLRRILDDAGLDPLSPKKEGWIQWIDATANHALTEALAFFAVHSGVTVGQSVAAVAWASEGTNPVVYDDRWHAAAATYQPKKREVFAAPDSGGAAGGAAAAAAAAACGGGAAAADDYDSEDDLAISARRSRGGRGGWRRRRRSRHRRRRRRRSRSPRRCHRRCVCLPAFLFQRPWDKGIIDREQGTGAGAAWRGIWTLERFRFMQCCEVLGVR
jgi:hypothetical protein